MPSRFYLDADVPLLLTEELQRSGHDAVHVRDLGTSRQTDAFHLMNATLDQRILVVHNRRDYALLHDAWHRWSIVWGVEKPHAGILGLPQNPSAHELFAAIEVFLLASLPIASAYYTFNRVTSWIHQPYVP